MMGLNDFRKQLDLATQGIPSKHPDAIRALLKEYSHKISLKCNPNFIDLKSDCFLFVFEEYVPKQLVGKIRTFSQNISKKPNVFKELLNKGFIELHDERKARDKIVVYFDKGTVTHFGKIENDKILSKWGVGLVWEQPLFEVPLSYGNEVKYSSGEMDVEVLENILRGS